MALGIDPSTPNPNSTLGVAYSSTLLGTGGTPPYTWAEVGSGLLPPGLSLNPTTGVISGIPAVVGSAFYFGVQVTDNLGAQFVDGRHINVNSVPIPPGPGPSPSPPPGGGVPMLAAPTLIFSVYLGIAGSLTIEIRSVQSIETNKPPVLYPPLRQPVVRGGQLSETIDDQWGRHWATPMTNRLNQLGGSSNLQLLNFEAPSLDRTDMGWYATGTVGIDDPVTLNAPLTGSSVAGRSFQAGDYIVWDDPTSTAGLYSYEIDRIKSVNGSSFQLSRSQQGQPMGQAYFGSVRRPHTNVKFYRLLDPTFRVLWDGSDQVFKFLWDQMIVSAVMATTSGTPNALTGLMNLFPLPPTAASLGLST